MELPEAYIPIDRRIALAHGVDLPDRTHGAALFADISGFTPLTELLAKELGPQRGAEELTKQLITIYSALIAQVDQYRGSVISFSGDAITCWFDKKDEGRRMKDEGQDNTSPSSFIPHPSSLRAVACALAMQEVMGCFATVETPSGASVTLAIKVATAAGPVRRCLAGDPQIQLIDVLAGATLDRLAVAEHQAGKGEVIASAEVAEQLGGGIEVREWREDAETGQRFAVVGGLLREVAAEPWPDLPPGALGEEQVRAWMLPGVYERQQTEQGQFLVELRPAVALFARFGGIDYDADADAAGKLDAYMRWAQRIVARYEGALLQLAIGDKGSYFHAAFGAPLAHDDDPARAVAAALELLALPPELSYIAGPQIGISRGRMRTGAYGGPTRRTYGVLGDDVNMAARLMGLADQGQILVSQSIADTVARRFTLRYVGPVSVKGKQAPVQVSEVLQRLVYLFKHIVTRDVAYETLLFDQRRQLHSMVGAALERLAPDATAQLAYHSFTGEDWARALRYQAQAGQQARKLFANHESIEHFRKALRCAERLPPEETAAERQQIHAGLGELLTSTGQYDPALEHLTEALALATALDAYDAQAHACRWIARLHENRGDYPHALAWIQRGLEALAGSATAAAAELLAIAGLIHTRQGNYDQAAQHCRDSLQIAETLGDTMALAFAYNGLGHITLLRGQSAKSIDYFQQSLDLYQQSGNIHGAALSHNQIANAYFNMGEWSGAVHNYRQARKIFNQTSDVYNLAITDNNLGELARYQGRLAEAVAFYQESLRSLEQIGGSRYVIGALHMNLGATFVRREEIDEARVHLRMSQEIFEQAEARDFLPELHRHFAATALLAGDLPEAEAQGQQALGLARELGMRGDEGIILRVLGDVAATRGDFRGVEQRLNEGLLILEEVGDEYEGARTLLALAKVHLSHRRADQALDALQRCTDVFERLGATLDLLEAHAMRDDRLAVA